MDLSKRDNKLMLRVLHEHIIGKNERTLFYPFPLYWNGSPFTGAFGSLFATLDKLCPCMTSYLTHILASRSLPHSMVLHMIYGEQSKC